MSGAGVTGLEHYGHGGGVAVSWNNIASDMRHVDGVAVSAGFQGHDRLVSMFFTIAAVVLGMSDLEGVAE
jgi:hypothetical protein